MRDYNLCFPCVGVNVIEIHVRFPLLNKFKFCGHPVIYFANVRMMGGYTKINFKVY